MPDHPARSDASEPPHPQPKALHAFLLGLALCVRNTHAPAEGQALLEALQYRVGLFGLPYMMEKFQLSDADVAELNHIFGQFRDYLTNDSLALADPSEGPPH